MDELKDEEESCKCFLHLWTHSYSGYPQRLDPATLHHGCLRGLIKSYRHLKLKEDVESYFSMRSTDILLSLKQILPPHPIFMQAILIK